MASHTPRVRSTASAARPYGRDGGIGNGEPGDTPSLHETREAIEALVDLERRAGRGEEREPAERVDAAAVAREAGLDQHVRKLLIGGEKQLERRPVPDLSREGAGRAVHDLDADAAIAGELFGDLGQREVEVRRGGDDRAALLVAVRHQRAGPERDRQDQAGQATRLPGQCRDRCQP